MISFKNKKLLITNADTIIGRELSVKLNSLGAELILVGEDKEFLEEISHKLSDKPTIYINSSKEQNCQISNKNYLEIDGYIHCDFFEESDNKEYKELNRCNIEYYLQMLDSIKKSNSLKNISVLLLINTNKKPFENTSIYYYGARNMTKMLSLKYYNSKMRINTLISDTNEEEKLSNTAIYLLSTSSRYIIGEQYDISNN